MPTDASSLKKCDSLRGQQSPILLSNSAKQMIVKK